MDVNKSPGPGVGSLRHQLHRRGLRQASPGPLLCAGQAGELLSKVCLVVHARLNRANSRPIEAILDSQSTVHSNPEAPSPQLCPLETRRNLPCKKGTIPELGEPRLLVLGFLTEVSLPSLLVCHIHCQSFPKPSFGASLVYGCTQ